MLVSAKEMLDKAKAGHYAVGQFNINNLEWTKSVLLTAEELRSPVILGVSEGAGKYMTGFGTVAAMVKAMHDELGITVPVALHLDHGTYEGCYKCIKAGFTSIMFDGSHYPIDENVEKTKELVSVAHAMGMSIEAEVGSIGGEEDQRKNTDFNCDDICSEKQCFSAEFSGVSGIWTVWNSDVPDPAASGSHLCCGGYASGTGSTGNHGGDVWKGISTGIFRTVSGSCNVRDKGSGVLPDAGYWSIVGFKNSL